MGVDSRRPPPLPAPTETDTSPTELTTDVSKPGDDKSSYSIPEDGTPVTIRTRGHKANRSQTSLLIEYFEGGKNPSGSTSERKPSVRVRLTPSKKGKGDHIQVTETKGSRKASLTRRIPLDQPFASREIELGEGDETRSLESYASATEESNVSRNPIDIEIDRGHRRRRPASPLIPSGESYQPGNPSEISAIPTDSFLDGTGPADLRRDSSPSRGKALAAAAGVGALAGAALHGMSDNKSRSSGRDRIKITDKSMDKSDRKRRSKSRTSSLSEHTTDELRSPRRRSGRSHQESTISGADSSVLSSNLSPSHRSLDAHSMRSGTSKSSINNPKLLETVEDAIRRLILPELSALKREQSKRESRRGSLTSTGTSVSREDVSTDRRRSSGQRAADIRESPKNRDRRNREARHDYENISLRSPSHDSLDADYQEDETDITTPRRSNGLLRAAAAGAAGAAAAKGLSATLDDRSQPEERKQRERRRRRTEGTRSRSLGREKYADEYDDDYLAPAPPMPLMSDVNPSELTRTSILSAATDRPHSASEEFLHETSRGVGLADDPPTPSRTPVSHLQESLGTRHANISHGDLTALPRGKKEYVEEYETDEFGHKIPLEHHDHQDHHDDYREEVSREVPEPVDYPEEGYDNGYYSTQDVPPPLKYVPYQAGARGLSPIPSVSGYTEGGSEAPQQRDSRSMHSASEAYSALDRSPEHRLHHSDSAHSLGSAPSNMRSREFDDEHSFVSAGGRRDTTYTDVSQDDHIVPRQAVRGAGANPNFVHPPMGVESAVASLVDGSMLEQSVLTSGSGQDYSNQRGSALSYEDQDHHMAESSRALSPEKMSIDSHHEYEEEHRATPGSGSHDQSREFSEYEIDEHGRKVPRSKHRQSPTASEVAITAGAVGVVAAALKAAQEKRQATVEDASGDNWNPAGVSRNKSFKERTMEGREPRNTPAHSIDRMSFDDPPVKMGATGLPDLNDPMPEVGYLDDRETNASVVEERLDGEHDDGHWDGRATPTQRSIGGYGQQETPVKDHAAGDRGLGITEVAGAAALGAAAGMAATHSREPSQDVDDWHRTSDDRKRDTLVTNPYEDASPIVNPTLNDNLLSSYNPNFHTGSPGFAQKYDEGYMSNGPNRTPEPKGKGVDFAGPVDTIAGEDPFYVTKDPRHLSGMSHGMGSPFYDAATGAGIDRIENKDIVALMQHLMVRDAQRSARDTEIVALLMNAALEMRNSFREMKDLIQDTGDDVIFANVENTEKLQKAINGPRPFPGTGSRSIQSASAAGTLDDINAKKKNLWKRALQGLSARGTSDLTRIEDMLMQLLGEVDVLKTQTAAPGSSGGAPGQSFENLQPEVQYEQDRGYEPEGASTPSHPSQSGHFVQSQARGLSSRLSNEHRYSDHRISTVQEHEEEEDAYDHPSPAADRTDPNLLAPAQPEAAMRGSSVPLETPPRTAQTQQPLSAENTPRTDKGRKHKSSSSSGWIPKISRWSETTASSVGRAFRSSGTSKKEPKYDDYPPPSRSGSSLASYDEQHYQHDPYGGDKLHSGFSDPSLQAEEQLQAREQQMDESAQHPADFMTPEEAKYQVHRNSLNLQHPQPRPGQTERFRTALEYSAQEYDTPMTPKSTDWAGSATSLNRLPANTQRYSNTSSAAAREPEYWPSSPTGPPRPPKEPIDNTGLTPPKTSRPSKLQKSSPLAHPGYASNYSTMPEPQASEYDGSPKLENRNLNAALGVPTRRPSGPRAMTPKTLEEEAAREERRRKRDTFGTVGTVGSADTDTF